MSGPAMVTGAAGFIGSHLVRSLADRAIEVRAVDRKPDPGLSRSGMVRYTRADVRDAESLKPILEGVDAVYHLASTHLEVTAGEGLYREVNVEGARRVAAACAAAGVRRMVHVSTVGVYGHVTDPPAHEGSPTNPGNAYERTKLEGERAVRGSAVATGLELIVLRPAWVYGPGCPRMAKLLRSVERGRFFFVGAGDNLRHPVYISDAVQALVLAAAAPSSLSGRIYNIAGPRFMELRELVDTCAQVLGVESPRRRLPRLAALALGRTAEVVWGAARREPPFSRRSLVFFENDNAFDIGAARRDLGFEPQVDLEEGIRRTAEIRLRPIET